MVASSKSSAKVASVTLVVGGDAYLNELNSRDVREKILSSYPEADVVYLDAANSDQYEFNEAVGPSLFSQGNIVVISDLQNSEESFVAAVENFCKESSGNAGNAGNADLETNASWVIARHEGGVKGKSIITRLQKAGAQIITVPDLKKDDAKLNFVLSMFERRNRTIEPQAAQKIVAVLGGKTEELAALCSQLCFDYDDSTITLSLVDRYLLADPQVTGFFVADKAAVGNYGEALLAARTAVSQGIDHIALIGALAAKIRLLAKAIAVRDGSISQAESKANPWAIKMAMRQLAGWNNAGIAECIKCLAWADEQCKSGKSDADYALEYAIMLVASRGHKKE